MGWANCGTDSKGRPIGYGFVAYCDHPGCGAKIDRGLAYACGGMHGDGGNNGDFGCEGYFCTKHLVFGRKDQLCHSCATEEEEHHKQQVEERRNRMLARLSKEQQVKDG